jgi:hypothetical protein
LISSAVNGRVDGLRFRDEDILAYNPTTGLWSMLFDGSDVGLGNTDVVAFHFLSDNAILLSFDRPIRVPGVGTIDDSDIVKFTYSQLGTDTSGGFSWFVDGSDVGLSSAGERIDAIAFDTANRLIISTVGTFKVPGLSGLDEDLFALSLATSGADTTGVWEIYVDGSDVALTRGSEDVNAVWIEPSSGQIYVGAKGNFAATGSNTITGDANSIVICDPLAVGESTNCAFAPFFDASSARFSPAIDGFGLRALAPLAAEGLAIGGEGSADAADEGAPYPVALDEAVETAIDAELDEYDLRAEEEEIRYFFLPFITR